MTDKKTIFVTGFPGTIAKNVSTGLMDSGFDVRLLACSKHKKEASRFASSSQGAISIVEGTLGQIDFGLSGKNYLELATEVTDIVYCNLPSQPGSPSADIQVKGHARELVELSLASTTAPGILFLSHFDVAGNASGVFAEQDLDLGQTFAGKADEDRFRAEKVLRNFSDQLPITIVRTGWVLGEGAEFCPLIELLLAQEDVSSFSDRALLGPLPFIDSTSICDLLVNLVRSKPGNTSNTWHVSLEGIPKLEDLVAMVKSIAEDAAVAGFDLVHGAKHHLRKSPPGERWSSREFVKQIQAGTRIASGRTQRALEEVDLTLPEFDANISRLVTKAVNRISVK